MEKNLKIETLRFEKVDGWFCGLYRENITGFEFEDKETCIKKGIKLTFFCI